jgi:hypothetical protein
LFRKTKEGYIVLALERREIQRIVK